MENNKTTIVIDVGHGINDPGAVYEYDDIKYTEYELNVKNANLLKKQLEEQAEADGQEIQVVLTNDPRYREPVKRDFKGRRDVALAVEADLYISMHANASKSSSAKGTRIYVDPRANQQSRNFADVVNGKLSTDENIDVNNIIYELERGHTGPTGYMIRTGIPTILVETGFMSNREDMMMMLDDKWAENSMRLIAESSREYLDNPRTTIGYDYSIARNTRHYGGKLLSENTYNKEDAKNLQTALSSMGFEVSINGVFDGDTKDKVIEFQKLYGLKVDGIVGPETFGKIKEIATEMQTGKDVQFARTNLTSDGLSSAVEIFKQFDISRSAEIVKNMATQQERKGQVLDA